jgi:hypothetical protein
MSIIKHGRGLQVRKKRLPSMSDAAYLDQAAIWSKDLTRMKARGPGDTENAMRQIERQYGVDYGFLWSLRYRRERLRTISISVYEGIRAAYRAECAAQMRKLENDIKRTEKIVGPDHHLVASARDVVVKAGEVK